jgi:hypothetical protein
MGRSHASVLLIGYDQMSLNASIFESTAWIWLRFPTVRFSRQKRADRQSGDFLRRIPDRADISPMHLTCRVH